MTFPRKRESNRRRFQWPNQKKKKLLITLFKVLVLKSEECIKQTLLQSLFLIKPITCTLPANQVCTTKNGAWSCVLELRL